MVLKKYHEKRNFQKTTEPKGRLSHQNQHLYIIQKHAASHLHYDFRLELNGVLKSWAVPKGPSLDPKIKRLAIAVEDHPIEYGSFEGIIPQGQYGGGTVMLWDKGIWTPLDADPLGAYTKGHLRFELKAEKLNGRWDLVRFKDDNHWFLIKYEDNEAKSESDYDILIKQPYSVLTQRTMDEISKNHEHIWTAKSAKKRSKPSESIKIQFPKLPLSPFPQFIPPQLATLVSKPPAGEEWLHEIKFDGYRILAFINNGQIVLKSRNNKDWTVDFPEVVASLQKMNFKNCILDGEIVILDENGKSDFQLLQNSIKANRLAPFVYYIFDLLYYDHYDLMPLPQIDRKELLRKLLKDPSNNLRFSDYIQTDGEEVFEHACHMALEGIISKQANAPYLTKRTKNWLKIKCIKRQEFVIGGYTPPKGNRSSFGSLFLGVFNSKKELEFAGNVGTGFTNTSLKELYEKLQAHVQKQNPFNSTPPESKHATWLNPVLVADIEFSEWTLDGHLRHPSFKGLRSDKRASMVKKEIIKPVEKVTAKTSTKETPLPFKITHPEKILYPEDKITKEELLNYYDYISPLMLPYLKNRPLTLLRCPDDYKQCFYQRHFNKTSPHELKSVLIKSDDGEGEYIYLKDKKGLLSLVQMGVLEIHPWASSVQHIEEPNWITIDLDPAPDVSWKEIVDAAFDLKNQLEQYKLKSFIKTTGGKGLHLVIPIKPKYSWNEIKNFSHVFVNYLEQLKPEKYISKMSKAKRTGKIFIDYLRNQRSATAVSVYSTRARIHAPISTPIDWDELTGDKRDTDFNLKNIRQRIEAQKEDPWHLFLKTHQLLPLDEGPNYSQ